MDNAARKLEDLMKPDLLVENVYAFAVLTIFLVMYGPRLHMSLPPALMSLFDNVVFRASVIFLIVYMSQKDFVGALTITLIFMITLNIIHTRNVLDDVGKTVSNVGNTMKTTVTDVSNTVINSGSSINTHVQDTVKDTSNLLYDTAKGAGNVIHNTVDNTLQLANNTVSDLSNVAGDTIRGASDIVLAETDNLVDAVGDVSKLAGHALKGIASTAGSTIGGAATLLGETVDDSAQLIGDTVGGLTGVISDTLGDGVDVIQNTLHGVSNAVSKTSANLFNERNATEPRYNTQQTMESPNLVMAESDMANVVNAEGFTSDVNRSSEALSTGNNVANCANYSNIENTGTMHYPINPSQTDNTLQPYNNVDSTYSQV